MSVPRHTAAAAVLSLTAMYLTCALPGAVRDVAAGVPIVRPFTRPATRPVSEPVPATVSPQAAELLKRISAAYSSLKSLELAGNISFAIVEQGTARRHEARFTSAFAAPNRFRHEIPGEQLFGSTGRKVYAWSEHNNAYIETDCPPGRFVLKELPADHAQALPAQNPSLVLAISRDPEAELRRWASDISVASDSAPGQPALRVVAADRSSVATVFVDPQSWLIRRVVADYKPLFASMGRDDISSAVLAIDYTLIRTDAPLADDAFEWSPPPGARELAAVSGEQNRDQQSPLTGRPAPDFALKDLDGRVVRLADLRGSVVLLDFWATWCPPCRASLPGIAAIHKEKSPAGLKVFAVNLREDRGKIAQFLRENKLDLPVLMDEDGAAAGAYGITAIPATVLIGKDGVVRTVIVGFEPSMKQTLSRVVEELMK